MASVATLLTPERAEFCLLSFEGPDPYSRAGGLGVRVTQLARALAGDLGFTTHLLFVGDPQAPGVEEQLDGRLKLYRWSQWISRYYPQGVYDGELEKLYDFNETVPPFVAEHIARPALARGKVLVVLAEEWHTAHALCELSDHLHYAGLRPYSLLAWNANNTMGFDRINWGRLGYVATLTTVSRYMKHVMWGRGVNPLVIPNGLDAQAVAAINARGVAALRRAMTASGGQTFLVKVGRFDPDKRWLMAIDALALLRGRGLAPRLIMRGGIEPHQHEVLERARAHGLSVKDVWLDGTPTASDLAQVIAASPGVDIFHLRFFVPDPLMRALYRAADAVLANSGIEPFGLVGLEVMGAGGVAVTGATGEDYAVPFENAVVLDTDDPQELAYYVADLSARPQLAEHLREAGQKTAQRYLWPNVLTVLLGRLAFRAAATGLAEPPAPPAGTAPAGATATTATTAASAAGVPPSEAPTSDGESIDRSPAARRRGTRRSVREAAATREEAH